MRSHCSRTFWLSYVRQILKFSRSNKDVQAYEVYNLDFDESENSTLAEGGRCVIDDDLKLASAGSHDTNWSRIELKDASNAATAQLCVLALGGHLDWLHELAVISRRR